MIDALQVILLSGLGLCGISLVGYWAAVGYHVVRTMVLVPTARQGLKLPVIDGELPRLCVLVPAHNEEACIATVAASLAAQDYPIDRISLVFVLDRCTDRTRDVLDELLKSAGASGRAEIIELDSCPPGWVGKTHALWSGVQKAIAARNADLLLFVDADTTLDPRLVRASVALMRARQLGLLSLLSTLTYDQWFEQIVQPAAGMELMRQFPVVKANGGAERGTSAGSERRRPFANGQFILIRRADYLAFGGHDALRLAVMEDIEMAKTAYLHGIAGGFFLDGGMLRCRMYESYAALRRGWKRIFIETANRKPQRLRKIARRIRLLGTVLPVLTLAGLGVGLLMRTGSQADLAWASMIACSIALFVWLAVLALTFVLGRIPILGIFAFPIGSWITGGVMYEAAKDLERGKPTEWGGMSISRETR